MNGPTHLLHDSGQLLWLDHVERILLRSGKLQHYIDTLEVTGSTFNLTRFSEALAADTYDGSIRVLAAAGLLGQELFFTLAMEDLTQAADLLRPIFDASKGANGWVSLPLSPLLADSSVHTIQAATRLFAGTTKANLFVQIPATPEGVRALEALTFSGVPVDATLLFSPEHYLAAASAYLRGIERRLAAGLDPQVASLASVCVSDWDVAVRAEIASPFHNRLGIAMAMRTYRAYRHLLASDRWQKLQAAGAQPQRLQWVRTETMDPPAPDTLYVQALAAPDTIMTLSERTLIAFADHGHLGTPLPLDAGYADDVLEEFRREGVDDTALAQRLQTGAVKAATVSWYAMLSRIADKSVP